MADFSQIYKRDEFVQDQPLAQKIADDVRRRLALTFVGQTDRALSEISDKLGFSHGAAFHRAFKRWTALTPLAYRRSHGR